MIAKLMLIKDNGANQSNNNPCFNNIELYLTFFFFFIDFRYV